MEHVIAAESPASSSGSRSSPATPCSRSHPLALLEATATMETTTRSPPRSTSTPSAPTSPRCIDRHALTLDAARPDAVARRRRTGQRTARENIDDLCDPGTFVEYGALVVAAQRRRRTLEDLDRPDAGRRPDRRHRQRQRTLFGDDASRCVVMSYDYTVLAGTQGTAEPPEEGPAVRARRALAAAGRVLHRGRRRPARRHRRRRRSPGSTAWRSTTSASCRARAARRHQLGPLLRRQRRAPRLLRRGDRDRETRTSAWAGRR